MKKRKILRICMTYPRDKEPGAGLHGFYHSLYSESEELIITSRREGNIIENAAHVPVIEIKIKNPKLGKYDEGKVKRTIAFVKKLRSQIDFKNKAKKYVDDFQPDIVHIYSPIPILTALYAKRKFKSKIVLSLHGSDALRIGKERFFRHILKIPDAVVTVGENMESMLNGAKTRKPIICIGNGVDLSVFRDLHLEREHQFIHVANLRWQKGQQYLMEGFSLFYQKHPDYRLIVIGDGEEREALTILCDKLGILDAVDFKGTQGRNVIVEELNKSCAFVLSSVSEGFPKVVIEAMATGTPVISSDVGNVNNVVGDSGIIFHQKDAAAINMAMEEIISDQIKWKEKSILAKKLSQRYSWENHTKRLNEVYDEVLIE